MGRNKFEDQFKNKLGKREIAPSEGSWDKLSGQLNLEKKKQSPVFWWIGIAATLLGAILIVGIVYNNNPAIESPGLVESPVEEQPQDNMEPITEEAIATEENSVPAPPKTEDSPTQIERAPLIKNLPREILITEVNKEDLQISSEEMVVHDDEKISQKLEDILAEASLRDPIEGEPDMNEIDSLLYNAASEISIERKKLNSSGTVDAADLLYAVEMELEESFREKVFEILKEGYLKARTAVANRNYP